MEIEFIPYEEALALKELGFDDPCLSAYRNSDGEKSLMALFNNWTNSGKENTHEGYCSAPLYQQAFRWFREKYDRSIYIGQWEDSEDFYFDIYKLNERVSTGYKTYEEAELACLRKLIEIVKNKG